MNFLLRATFFARDRCILANEMFTLGMTLWRMTQVKFRAFAACVVFAVLLGASGAASARAVAVGPGNTYGNLAWFLVAFELGPWEEYLIRELTPDLDRLTADSGSSGVSWIHVDADVLLPDFAAALLQQSPVRLTLAQRGTIRPDLGVPPLGAEWQQLERSLMMPGITARVSDRSALSVAAVLATQRFVAAGMNLSENVETPSQWRHSMAPDRQQEVLYGAGVRLALSGEPVSGVVLEASFQSRIDMSEMASLTGVHGSRAELDIPSRMQLGLKLQTGARAALNFGVEQIFYSEVGAFPSRALPARFNALLGDSTSPEFGWEDLLVYHVGWVWRHESRLELSVDYRTRSQPRPSAPALASALAPELAQNAFLVGLSKDLNDRSRLSLSAAYAPPEFAFGGNVLGIVADRLDQSLEVQAVWRHQF